MDCPRCEDPITQGDVCAIDGDETVHADHLPDADPDTFFFYWNPEQVAAIRRNRATKEGEQ